MYELKNIFGDLLATCESSQAAFLIAELLSNHWQDTSLFVTRRDNDPYDWVYLNGECQRSYYLKDATG